ncbi:hypothetical protein F5B21DRAFT_520487 [Xylaria acuta]|nr:hypothetical protein F5B21DRAFT_520487 [Xylaria acuta]
MSQPKGKTNFKTYEASTRLLAAVIATTGVKLDYNEIAKHVGGGVGVDAINHRFRPIKQLAKMQTACVKKGGDPGELPTDKGGNTPNSYLSTRSPHVVSYIVFSLPGFHQVQPPPLAENFGGGATAVGLQHRLRPVVQLAKLQLDCRTKGKDPGELPTEKGEIQKLFGESTPKGLEWQFRDIKNIGKAQQEAVKKGDNPATVLAAGTPSAGRGRGRGAGTPGSGATARTPGSGSGTGTGTRGRKRKVPTALLPPVESSDENGGADDNDSDFGVVETPSKRPAKRAATASARKANGSVSTPTITTTPAKTAAAMTPGTAATPVSRVSIFGGDNNARAPAIMRSTEPFDDGIQMNGGYDAEYVAWTPKPVARPTAIKKEFGVGANTFLASVNPGGFDDGDFEDGEI